MWRLDDILAKIHYCMGVRQCADDIPLITSERARGQIVVLRVLLPLLIEMAGRMGRQVVAKKTYRRHTVLWSEHKTYAW